MITAVNNKPASLYSDTHAINNIKYQADQESALRMAAQQFEAMLYQQILKSMRASTDLINDEDNALSNKSQGVMRDMYDGQLAMQMAKGGKGSISDMLVTQLSPFKGEVINQYSANNKVAFQQLTNSKEMP